MGKAAICHSPRPLHEKQPMLFGGMADTFAASEFYSFQNPNKK
jgi:hypothetical protein